MNLKAENSGRPLSEQAIDWLVLLRSGNVNVEHQRAFDQWLQQDIAHRKAFADAEALWQSAAKVLAQTPPVNLPSWQNKDVSRQVNFKSRRSYHLASAASFLLAVWLGWSVYGDQLLSDYSTAPGEQKHLTLADGSSVFMNTGTAIALEWTDKGRKTILLKGQAEFKVAPDVNRPFDVVTGNATIRALGTTFEVYRVDSDDINVNVSEHAVGVSLQNEVGNHTVKVNQGEQLIYKGATTLPLPQPLNLNQSQAWQRGKIIFRDQSLSVVIAELNRYSKAKILLQGNDAPNWRVSGVFPTDSQSAIQALQQAFPIRILQLGPWLTVLYS